MSIALAVFGLLVSMHVKKTFLIAVSLAMFFLPFTAIPPLCSCFASEDPGEVRGLDPDEIGTLSAEQHSKNAILVGHLIFGPCLEDGVGWESDRVDGFSPRALAVSEDFAYVADEYIGIRIVNASDPSDPFEEGCYVAGGRIWDLFAEGSYLYVVTHDPDSLITLDISSPSLPRVVGSYAVDNALTVVVEGSLAFVSDVRSEVWILDNSDPSSQEFISCAPAPGAGKVIPGWLFVAGDYLYVGSMGTGLNIWDLSIIEFPDLWGVFEDKRAWHPFVSGDYAFVGGGPDGFYVLDVSDPSDPVEIGSALEELGAGYVYVVGSHAYVTAGDRSLTVLIVDEPTQPVVGGYYQIPGTPGQVVVQDGLAYFIDEDGLYIVSFTPTSIGLSWPSAMWTGKSVVVRWHCSSADFLSFDVLRASVGQVDEESSVEYERVNRNPIVGSGNLSFMDETAIAGRDYLYKVRAVEIDGALDEVGPVRVSIPPQPSPEAVLRVNPNPSSESVDICYSASAPQMLSLRVFTVDGRLVRVLEHGWHDQSLHSLTWDCCDQSGRKVPSGVYFLLLESDGVWKSEKVSITR